MSYSYGPSHTFNFNGGTLTANGTFSLITTNTTTTVKSGGARFNVVGANTLTVANNLTTDGTGGGLTKNGTGTLTLTGNNTYTGVTTVNAGTLTLNNAAGGSKTIAGDMTINGGRVAVSTSHQIADTSAITITSGSLDFSTLADAVGSFTMSGGNLRKAGTSGELLLNAASSFTGGTVDFASNAARVTTNATTTLGNATFDFSTASGTSTQGLKLGGDIVVNANTTANFTNSGSGLGRIDLNAATRTIDVGTGGAMNVGWTIAGSSVGITKNGSGTLTLTANNTYNGTTTINAGTLRLGGSGTSTIAGDIAIAGGELNYSNASDNQIADTANITMSSGAMTMGTRAETINSLAQSGGDLTIGSGTLSLSAASSFTGGNVSMTSVSSRINPTGAITLGSATFSYNNASDATSGIILAGDFLVNDATTANFTNAAAGSGRINLGSSNRVFDVGTGANMNVGWYLDATNASGAVTKNGSGTLTLSGNNTYTGTTTINAGTLQISGSGLLGAGSYATAITNNGTFLYNGTNSQTLSGVMSGSGDLTKSNTGTLILSNNNTFTGATAVNAGTLQIGTGGTSGSLSSSSAITNSSNIVFNRSDTLTQGTDFANSITGSGNITQSGSGTLILGTNTYSGATTVNAGTLQLSGNISSSALTVGTGSIISIGNTTAAAKASASSITLQGGSGYAFTIGNVNASVAGTDYDQLATAGVLTLNNTAANPFTIYISGTPTGWNNTGTYSWDLMSAASVTGFNSANFTWNFDNFGIAGGNRTGTWDILNTGGLIQLTYAAATPNHFWSGASGNWTTGFTPSRPTTDKNIYFIGGVGGTATNNIASGTLSSLNFITFNSTAGSYTLAAAAGSAGASGGTPLTVKGDITNNSANAQTINMDLALVASSTGIFNAAAGNLTIGGVISGAAPLTKQGSSTLILSANNTYSGATLISAGTLQIGAGGTSGALNANSTITNCGTIAFNRSNTITQGTDFASTLTGAGHVAKLGSGTLLLTGNNTYTGTTTISAGTLELGTNGRLGGGAYSGNIANSGTFLYSGTNAQTLSGIISGSGALTQNNSTGMLTLSGNNTYTGTTTISAGTLQISSTGRLGGGNYTGNISNSGTFLYNGTNSQTLSGVISGTGGLTKNGSSTLTLTGSNTYNGAITINAGTVEVGASGRLGAGTYSGNIAINNTSAAFIFAGTNSQTISGAVSGNGAFTMNGTGTLTFSGAKSYTGGTTVNAGTLSITAGAISGNIIVNSGARLTTANHNMFTGSPTLTVNGGTLDLSVYAQGSGPGVANFTDATITGGGGFLRGVPTYNFSGNNSWGGGLLDLLTAPTLNVANGTTTFSSAFAISNGNSNITKTGNGTLVLSAANTYTSATILNAGTLAINHATGIGNGTLTLNGGTLDNTSGAAITLTNNNTQNWNGNFTFAGTNNLNLGTGNVTMNASRTVTVSSGTLTVGGIVTNSATSFTKNGSGTLVFAIPSTLGNSSSSYFPTGNITVNRGGAQV